MNLNYLGLRLSKDTGATQASGSETLSYIAERYFENVRASQLQDFIKDIQVKCNMILDLLRKSPTKLNVTKLSETLLKVCTNLEQRLVYLYAAKFLIDRSDETGFLGLAIHTLCNLANNVRDKLTLILLNLNSPLPKFLKVTSSSLDLYFGKKYRKTNRNKEDLLIVLGYGTKCEHSLSY